MNGNVPTNETKKWIFLCALQLGSRDECCYFARRPLFGNDTVRAHGAPLFLSAILLGDTSVWKRSEIQNAHSTASTTAARISTQLIYGAQWRHKISSSVVLLRFTSCYLHDSGFDMCAINISHKNTQRPTSLLFCLCRTLDPLTYFQLSIPRTNITVHFGNPFEADISGDSVVFFFFSIWSENSDKQFDESIRGRQQSVLFRSSVSFRSSNFIIIILVWDLSICFAHSSISKIVCDRAKFVVSICVVDA